MKRFRVPCLLLLCLLLCPPVLAGAAETWYVTNPDSADRLNLRREAHTESESIGRFYSGTAVQVVGTSGSFSSVRVGSLSGYMQTSYLTRQRPQWQRGRWAVVNLDGTGETLNLRAQAQRNAAILGAYPNGTAVQILGEAGDFYHVRTVDMDGYMQRNLLRIDPGKDALFVSYVHGSVKNNNVNLRSFPSRMGISMQQLSRADEVQILDICGPWFYVQAGNQAEAQRGFILGNQLTVYVNTSIEAFAMVDNPSESDRLHLRQGKGEGTTSLGRYYNNTQMNVLQKDGDWWYVRMGPDGKEGYMKRTYLQMLPPARWE